MILDNTVGNLYFKSREVKRLIAKNINFSDCGKLITQEVKRINANFKIYYTRIFQYQEGDKEFIIDFGSHSEFFIFEEVI